jgi:uncharacterized protein YkwD
MAVAIDLIVLIVIAYYAIHGFRRGFLVIFLELLTFAIAFGVAIFAYRPVADLLMNLFGTPEPLAKPVALLGTWILLQILGFAAVRPIIRSVPVDIHASLPNRIAGTAISSILGLAIVGLILTLIVVAPVPGAPRQAVLNSKIGNPLVEQVSRVERQAARLIGDAVLDTLTFLTIRPEPDERVELRFRTTRFSPSPEAEAQMLVLVNRERRERGLPPLRADETLRTSARAHSADMLENGYFSHTGLDGSSPFERMRRAGARFLTAGENLAFAPTVQMAHRGLMNSPGHSANILNPAFRQVGIGIQDAGVYGLMVTQNFAG